MSKKDSEETNEQPEETESAKVAEAQSTGGNGTELLDDELKALKEKASKAEENWERVLRMTAEMDNYKKRSVREKDEAVRYANERFIGRLLPVLDSFTMAVAATESSAKQDVEMLKVGINMILTQFQGVLKDMNVEELDAAGKDFDPTWQEAMSQEETDEVEEGKVLQQLRKGYKLKDRLIRPASVIVAKKPGPKSVEDPKDDTGEPKDPASEKDAE
ncbi:MAG: nucleotide exchange factor GrpE [Limisphaerales bacterium]